MEHRLTDERLCWLAVRDELDRRTRSGLAMTMLRLFASNSCRAGVTPVRSVSGDMISERLMDYAFAVDELAASLDVEERATLRATGEVPAWFLPRVEERARQIRRAGKPG